MLHFENSLRKTAEFLNFQKTEHITNFTGVSLETNYLLFIITALNVISYYRYFSFTLSIF